jgi:hypothetical protein
MRNFGSMSYNGKSIGEVREKIAENEQLKTALSKKLFLLLKYKN